VLVEVGYEVGNIEGLTVGSAAGARVVGEVVVDVEVVVLGGCHLPREEESSGTTAAPRDASFTSN